MSAFEKAWQDEEACEPYTRLSLQGRALRDAAQRELADDAVGAVLSVTYSSVDEIAAVLSWVEDPLVWKRPGVAG